MASFVSAANLGGVADPRIGTEADDVDVGAVTRDHHPTQDEVVRRHSAIYVDPSITFEDYHYWAQQSREFERTLETKNVGLEGHWNRYIRRRRQRNANVVDGEKTTRIDSSGTSTTLAGSLDDEKAAYNPDGTLKKTDSPASSSDSGVREKYGVTDSEWEQASRAMRTATWGSIFYLITTDILGPFNVPWAISRMGYGPGFALYTTFGGMACYSGLQIWQMFIGLDSTKYPMRNYGDLAFRVYGNWARVGVNVLQSFQFFLNVTLLIESNGQGLAQMAVGSKGTGFLCFAAAEVIFMAGGVILGQIRTLQRLSWLANLAIWLNVIVIIMTMIVTAYYPPNYEAIYSSYQIPKGPIVTSANWPANTDLMDRINGLMNGVFAFGGATLFNELMAEMRRPMDFWKGFIIAEIFIYSVYMIMGMVVYTNQGQFVYNIAYQGISNNAYGWQTLGNAVSFVSGLIAALLYGNIGVKVFYAAVLRDVFHFPALDKRRGKIVWIILIPLYWGLAFILAAAIPQIANLTAFVGAACILQFSYTFPPILKVGYNCQKDAMHPDETYDPSTGHVERIDSGWKRWARGFKKQLLWNTFDSVYFLGALATAGLGIWAACISMHDAFEQTSLTPFSCKNPVS